MLSRHGVLAAAIGVLVIGGTAAMWLRAPAHPLWRMLLDAAFVLSVCGTLLLLRRRPVTGSVYALVATGAYYILSPADGPLIIVPIVTLYGVAASGRVHTAAALGALLLIWAGFGTLAGNEDVNGVGIIMMTGWVVAVVSLGAVRHGRQEALRAAVGRAEEEARRRATEERLRIARELHDVVGHHLSMINVQAGTALHRLHRDPEQAGRALGVIKEASKHTLREMRAALGVLRAVDEEPGTAPAGRLERLDELVRHAELASLETSVRVEGDPRPLPAGVDLAAYRILQESITNVTRHAAARRVTLRIGYGTADLLVEVEDDGRGAAVEAGGDGSGIRGMRERARALGGELTAGPLPGGGFRVRARLPYGADYGDGYGADP